MVQGMTDKLKNPGAVAVLAGEPSGDWIAANAVRALQQLHRDIRCFGIGGDKMAAANVDLVRHISTLTALGPLESFRQGPRWLSAFGDFRLRCREQKPFAALLVDCPEINLPMARALKADGIRVLQYMGPKVWAWRRDRLRLLRRRTDMVALGFAFEKKMYDEARVTSRFVGHPLLDGVPFVSEGGRGIPTRDTIRRALHVPGAGKVVALFPGSRKSELKHHGEIMIEAGVRLLKEGCVPVFAPYRDAAPHAFLDKARSLGCVVWERPVRELLPGCDAALAVSGTVTLEIALAGVPMAIVYKMDAASYWLGKRLLKIPYIGLPNWVAEQKVIPELLQDDVTAQALSAITQQLLSSTETRRQKKALADVSKRLGSPGAALRVAEILCDWMD